jgi:hypothetical protein
MTVSPLRNNRDRRHQASRADADGACSRGVLVDVVMAREPHGRSADQVCVLCGSARVMICHCLRRLWRIGSITHVFRENPAGNRPSNSLSVPESPRPSHHPATPALCHRYSPTLFSSQPPWPEPPAAVHPAPPCRAGNLAVRTHESLLAPRHTHPSGGARGAGNRKPSRTCAVSSTCARILPITTGLSFPNIRITLITPPIVRNGDASHRLLAVELPFQEQVAAPIATQDCPSPVTDASASGDSS